MNQKRKRMLLQQMLLLFSTITLSYCTKAGYPSPSSTIPPTNNTPTAPSTPADFIVGKYNGTGKRLPEFIKLGSFSGCGIVQGWESNFVVGAATLDIAKVDSNLIRLTFVGGPFSVQNTYVFRISKNDNIITMPISLYGSGLNFDIVTKVLTVSVYPKDYYYLPSGACTAGLPYYYGTVDMADYKTSYFTIAHLDFSSPAN